MFQLITTVLAIALAGATTLITMKYTNPTLPLQQETQEQIERGFQSLQMGWDAFRAEHQTFEWVCDTLTTDAGTYESCKQALSDPGYLPVTGWTSALIPQYAFMPRPPKGMDWSYGTNSAGWYFCAEGTINNAQLKGIRRAQLRFPLETLVVSNTCGVVADLPDESLNLASMKVTYWVKRDAPGPDAFAMMILPQGAPPAYVAKLSFYERKGNWNEVPGDWNEVPSESGNDGSNGGGKNCNGKGNPDCNGNGNGNGKHCNGKGNPNCDRAKRAPSGDGRMADDVARYRPELV